MTLAANGVPAPHGGRKPRTPQPDSPAIAQRQARHFEYHLQGLSTRAIEAQTGFSRETVSLDIQMEGQLRAEEMRADRETHIATSIARYQSVITRCITRGELLRKSGTVTREEVGPDGQTRQIADVSSARKLAAAALNDRVLIAAQKAIDAIQGLHHTPEYIPPAPPTTSPVRVLIEAMDPASRIAALRQMAEDARLVGALPVMRNVTPPAAEASRVVGD